MGWESFDMVRFNLQSQMRTPKLKGAYKLLIIGPIGLQCETNVKTTPSSLSDQYSQ